MQTGNDNTGIARFARSEWRYFVTASPPLLQDGAVSLFLSAGDANRSARTRARAPTIPGVLDVTGACTTFN